MRIFLTLILKDLRRRLAAPAGVLISLAIPLAIAVTMALAFGGGGGGTGHPKLRFVVADLDATPLSNMIGGASGNPEAAEHLDIKMTDDRETGLRIMRDEDYAALLVIPKGFSEAILEGVKTELELVKNPSQRIMPLVAEQGAQVLALYLSTGTRFLDDNDIATLKRLLDGEGWDDAVGIAAMITDVYIRIQRSEELLFPPIITWQTEEEQDEEEEGFNFFSWMFPGMMIMGLLFVSLTQMKDMLVERQAGTLARQLSAPVGPGQLLVAKVVSVAVVGALAFAILLGAGALVFDIDWGSLAPLAATSALIVLAATGFAAFVFSIAKTDNQGDAIGPGAAAGTNSAPT
jgi:ABC-type Na+ efflux pump permease subunit